MNEKQILIQHLLNELDTKIESLTEAIRGAKESRASDTKSSAGDKFETGRAMMQMEIEKNENQLHKTKFLKNEIERINASATNSKVSFASLVITNDVNYFIAIPFGKLRVAENEYMCISLASPIGQAMQEKVQGDTLAFQDRSIEILNVF